LLKEYAALTCILHEQRLSLRLTACNPQAGAELWSAVMVNVLEECDD
jgi:hypothetical protein